MYTETKTLSNGVEMPMFGLGTWQIANEEAYRVVSEALSLGYRAVDTAAGYQNENFPHKQAGRRNKGLSGDA